MNISNGNPQPVFEEPAVTQRDPAKEFNQLRPTSLRSSGMELDPCCQTDLSKPVGNNLMGEEE